MKRLTPLFAFVLSIAVSTAYATALDTQKGAREKYERSLKQVKDGDLNIDWREFRLAAEVAGVSGSFDWHPVRNAVMKQIQSGDLEKALHGAQQIIDHNFADPEGHLLAMMVYQKINKQDAAAKERAIMDQIVHSILESGDGKAASTAFFTVNVSEEYFFIGVVMGASPKSQALVRENGHAFDKMTVTDRNGGDQDVWFNTDTDMQMMEDALNGKSK